MTITERHRDKATQSRCTRRQLLPFLGGFPNPPRNSLRHNSAGSFHCLLLDRPVEQDAEPYASGCLTSERTPDMEASPGLSGYG